MAVIGTAEFGHLTGQLSDSGFGLYEVEATCAISASDYLVTYINTSGDSGQYDNVVSLDIVLDGVHVLGDAYETTHVVDLPLGLGAAYYKLAVRETGQTKTVEVWVGAAADSLVKYITLAIGELPGVGTWSTDDTMAGVGNVLTAVAASAAITPSPNRSEWAALKDAIVTSDAYGRVTLYDAAGAVHSVFSNGYDGNDALVSLATKEFFDPASVLPQVNAGSFSLHTPFSLSTAPEEIDAFVADFAKNRCVKIERGYLSGDAEAQTYDTVAMGYFFITDARVNKTTWLLEVEFQDIFGTLSEVTYPRSAFWSAYGNINNFIGDILPDVISTSQAVLPAGVTIIEYDTAIDGHACLAPIPSIDTSLAVVTWLTNLVGGRWYLTNDGVMKLVCTTKVSDLDYDLHNLHLFSLPVEEPWDKAPVEPTAVSTTKWTPAETAEDIAFLPRFYEATGTKTVFHDPCRDQALYERVGGVDTLIVDGITQAYDSASSVAGTVWLNGGTQRETLVIKGIKFEKTSVDSVKTSGSVLNNPLVQHDFVGRSCKRWSFPTYAKTYKFSMRDDPSLKCGNIVRLAVDNEYRRVLLIEVSRSFNGAGRAEWVALHVADTGVAPFQTSVDASLVWFDETSAVVGGRVTWTEVTGFETWPNVNFTYRIYKTSVTPRELISATLLGTNEFVITDRLLEGDTFGIAVLVGGYVWPVVTIPATIFAHAADDYRPAGSFKAGQPRLY